jgi:Asp-tRNA(Asn)/Glu-tRNA(Gln) amidotransferase C subunit
LKSEAVRVRDRIRDLSREIDRARASGILSRIDANNYETETHSNLDEISELDHRLRKILTETRQTYTQTAQLRTFYRKDIAEVQQLNHETTELTADLKFLKLSVQSQKETLTSTDDQCGEIHSNVSRAEHHAVDAA